MSNSEDAERPAPPKPPEVIKAEEREQRMRELPTPRFDKQQVAALWICAVVLFAAVFIAAAAIGSHR